MALFTVSLYAEGILAVVMASTAGEPFFHIGHCRFFYASLERKKFCMTVSTLVYIKVKGVIKFDLATIVLKGYWRRFEPAMAPLALAAG